MNEFDFVPPAPQRQDYSWDLPTAHLYALGIGISPDETFLADATDRAFPTFATVIAREAGLNASDLDLKYEGVVLSRLRVRMAGRIAPAGSATVSSEVSGLTDLGGRGSELWISTGIDGAGFRANVDQGLRARLDGGRGRFGTLPDPMLPFPGTHDAVRDIEVAPNLAHIFRHLGDRNPLHVDAFVARAAGFPAPILHGQIVVGLTARCLGLGRTDRFLLEMRFLAPALSARQLRLEIAATSAGQRFRCLDGERRIAEGYWQPV